MSDIGIAPAPAPSAPSAAPAVPANEAAINPSPVNIPSPVGSQAPPKPPEAPSSRAGDRRESIQKAIRRAEEPGPAKAKMGHNQPPEPMEKEPAKKQPPLNLKKRPTEQEGAEGAQARGEHGHFAPRAASASQQASSAGQRSPIAPLPPTARFHAPPPRMTVQAQAEWAAAPESVRGEVYRMHVEFQRALQRYEKDHRAMRSIRPFQRMAREQGTTLRQALTNYVGIEQKLRSDPVGGLDTIVNNLNLRTHDGQQLGLRDVAWHVLNQTPDQHRMLQAQNVQTAHDIQIARMQQQIQALAQHNAQMQYAYQYHQTRSGVDRFADAHPRTDELSDLIIAELRAGYDLQTAYRRADLLRPATASSTRITPAQTRNSDRSIHGAPDRGPSANGLGGRRGDGQPSPSIRDATRKAFRAVNGAL